MHTCQKHKYNVKRQIWKNNKNGVFVISVSLDGKIFTIYPLSLNFYCYKCSSVVFGPALLDGIPQDNGLNF